MVLTTAYDARDLAEYAREAGVDYYLPKPFRYGELEQIVRQALTETL